MGGKSTQIVTKRTEMASSVIEFILFRQHRERQNQFLGTKEGHKRSDSAELKESFRWG